MWALTLVCLAAASDSRWSAVAGSALLLLVVYATLTLKRTVALCLLIVSTLFAGTSVSVLPVSFAAIVAFGVALAAAAGTAGRDVTLSLRGVGAAFLAVSTLALGAMHGFAYRQGSYVWQELTFLWLFIALVEVDARGWRSRARTEGVLFALGVVGAIAAVDALTRINADVSAFDAGRQLDSLYGGSNLVAALLSMVVVASWSRFVILPGSSRWQLLLAVVALAAMVPLASRTSSVITVAAMLVAGVASKRFRLAVALLGPVALYTIAEQAKSLLLIERLSQGIEGLETSRRTDLWSFTIELIQHNPLTGVGPGGVTERLLRSGFDTGYSHDVLLSLGAQYGLLVGLVAILVLIHPRSLMISKESLIFGLSAVAVAMFEPTIEGVRLGVVFVVVAQVLTQDAKMDDA